MAEWNFTALKMFNNANKLIEAYQTVLQPLCRETGMPPMALDILMFFANNPEYGTARDLCQCRGLKPGIVSVHIDRLVKEGLLQRQAVPGDRRKQQLVCTETAQPVIEKGRALQREFAAQILSGLSEDDIEAFRRTLGLLDGNIERIRKHGI